MAKREYRNIDILDAESIREMNQLMQVINL